MATIASSSTHGKGKSSYAQFLEEDKSLFMSLLFDESLEQLIQEIDLVEDANKNDDVRQYDVQVDDGMTTIPQPNHYYHHHHHHHHTNNTITQDYQTQDTSEVLPWNSSLNLMLGLRWKMDMIIIIMIM